MNRVIKHVSQAMAVRGVLVLICLMLTAALASAGQVTVSRLDGELIVGELVNMSPSVVIQTDSGRVEVSWIDVLSLETQKPNGQKSSPSAHTVFRLADGSTFAADIAGTKDTSLQLSMTGERICEVSLESLVEIVPADSSAKAAAKIAEIRASESSTDVIIISKGIGLTAVRGTVKGFVEAGIRFEWNKKTLVVPWDRLVGLFLANSVQHASPFTVKLRNGDEIAGRIVGGDQSSVNVRSTLLGTISLAEADIDRVTCRSDRVVFLDSLKPAQFQFTPMFTHEWSYSVNKTLFGKPIVLDGKTYEHGICLHSRSVLVYVLEGRYQRFAALVGIIDEMNDKGDVAVRILGDGKELWHEDHLKGGQSAKRVSLAIEGVKLLTLEVDFGGDLDFSDHVAWVRPRLVLR